MDKAIKVTVKATRMVRAVYDQKFAQNLGKNRDISGKIREKWGHFRKNQEEIGSFDN